MLTYTPRSPLAAGHKSATSAKHSAPAVRALGNLGESGVFGRLTLAGLAEYQTANGIAPSAGYFGAKTRTYISP
jgi:hypothetical protein